MEEKQNYIKPTIEIIEFASEILMSVVSAEQEESDIGNGFASDSDPELTRKRRRRGTWGNLWE